MDLYFAAAKPQPLLLRLRLGSNNTTIRLGKIKKNRRAFLLLCLHRREKKKTIKKRNRNSIAIVYYGWISFKREREREQRVKIEIRESPRKQESSVLHITQLRGKEIKKNKKQFPFSTWLGIYLLWSLYI